VKHNLTPDETALIGKMKRHFIRVLSETIRLKRKSGELGKQNMRAAWNRKANYLSEIGDREPPPVAANHFPNRGSLPEPFTHEMIVFYASLPLMLSLTLCFSAVFRAGRRRKTVSIFNGFYAQLKTADAVGTPPAHSYTPLKQGVNERTRSEW
jgi:hypothetical protein